MREKLSKLFFLLTLLYCFMPFSSGSWALLLGILLSLIFTNPYFKYTKKYTSQLLQLSVIGLGAGMNLTVIAKVGIQGIGYTVSGIIFSALVGFLLAKLLKTNKNISTLITTGTAICGGSAIAAVSPVIHAEDHDISVSLAAVFILNALALFIFPPIGHYFNFSEHQFGLWSALAIHDTSSVVGASMSYGKTALETATTVKLARALWIIPVTLIIAFSHKRHHQQNTSKKIKYPWFILGFLAMAALVTWMPQTQKMGFLVAEMAKKMLVITLFFIGSGLTLHSIKEVGARTLIYALSLWIIVAATSLAAISLQLIR